MMDEITKVNKQNGTYRALILSNENKMDTLIKEVEDL